ncbi:glycosyltransferase family 39 protein [Planctomonas psychrotolerans]|uniref:glycosyltransferase family 39 protein n=1 Tax=Planctomonas psychrotolerans TaxID=2528712 RepID=UPI00123996B6|nr:glycosyltransferase family 39 protein [Planctomonas psychrotolerans]
MHRGRRPRFRLDRFTVTVLAVVLLGVVLRLAGLAWGLPMRLHSDEGVIVTGALDLAERNSFEPSMYFRPDHFEIQLSYLAYTAYSYLATGSPVEVAYAANPAVFLLISRSITAVFGIVMIVLAYVIGRRFSRSTALIATALFALFPPFVEHSHYATPDIPLTAALMGVVLACMTYLERPRYPSLLVACAATAIAITIKYPGALASVLIAVVVILAAVRDRAILRIVRHGFVALFAVLAFVFLISPVLFTNISAVMAAIGSESRSVHAGADGLGWGGNLLFYAKSYVGTSGILLLIASALGVFAAVRLRLRQAIPLMLGGAFWVILSAVPLHWERWGVPMFTTPLLFAAIGIPYAFSFLARQRWARGWRTPVTVVAAVLVGGNLALGSAAVIARFLAVDTRVASAPMLETRGVDETNAIFGGYTPLLPDGPKTIFDELVPVDGELAAVDPDDRFVVISSCMYDRYFAEEKYETEQNFYAQLESAFTVELDLVAVDPWTGVAVEPLNMYRAAEVIGDYLAGGMSGCDIRLYRMT